MKLPDFIHFGGDEVRPISFEEARIVVLPLCYEHAPSYGEGSENGPLHLLNASAQLEGVDEETLVDWAGLAIHTLPPVFPPKDPKAAVDQMRAAADRVLDQGKFLLSLGGDHAVSLGPIQAAARRCPQIGVLQVDAHLDLRNEWNGSRYNHACVMRRVADDMGLSFVQVGIRSFSGEEAQYVKKKRLAPFYAHEIAAISGDSPGSGTGNWIEQVVNRLPEQVYLTLDLDGLDPAVMPGTGTPEPGGLTYRQVVRLLRAVGRNRQVIAADINELAKIPGTRVSEFTAAKLATKIFVHCT
jgi:agmatinase